MLLDIAGLHAADPSKDKSLTLLRKYRYIAYLLDDQSGHVARRNGQ